MIKSRLKLMAVLAVTSLLVACGGGGSSNSSSGALSGTDWTITLYPVAVNTSGCGWQMSFDIAGNYLETRTSDCGVGMDAAPCFLSGTYSGDTGGTFSRTITTDTCFSGGGSSVGTEILGYSIDTAPTPDVITVIRGVTTIITADKN